MKFNLDTLLTEFESLEQKLSNPEIFKDQKKVKHVSSRKKSIEQAVTLYREYKSLNESLEENKQMLDTESDSEMKDLIKVEISETEKSILNLGRKTEIGTSSKRSKWW